MTLLQVALPFALCAVAGATLAVVELILSFGKWIGRYWSNRYVLAVIGSPDWAIRAYRRLADMLRQVGRTAEADEILNRIGSTSNEGARQAQQAFEQLLSDTIASARGDAAAGQRAYQQAQAYQSAGASGDLRAIAQACQRILEGLRGDEVIAGLPDEIKPLIAEILKQIQK